jgi:hypothetical protein
MKKGLEVFAEFDLKLDNHFALLVYFDKSGAKHTSIILYEIFS